GSGRSPAFQNTDTKTLSEGGVGQAVRKQGGPHLRSVTRRWTISALALAGPAASLWPAEASAWGWPDEAPLAGAEAFSFEQLKQQAKALAGQPYRTPAGPPADLVQAMDYDAFGSVRYRASAALWGEAPGDQGVRFFPLGRPSPHPV